MRAGAGCGNLGGVTLIGDGPEGSGRGPARYRWFPALVAVGGSGLHVDIGLAASEGPLGLLLGLLAVVVGACWRITTPVYAPPLSVAVRPLGQPEDPDFFEDEDR